MLWVELSSEAQRSARVGLRIRGVHRYKAVESTVREEPEDQSTIYGHKVRDDKTVSRQNSTER